MSKGSPDFDPNAAAGEASGIYGLPNGPEEALVHVLPVPFDATASYGKGAADAPAAILRASRQVDLFDPVTESPWRAGIWMAPIEPRVLAWNARATEAAERGQAAHVNAIQEELNAWVEERTDAALARQKLVATLGGDHSVPLGAIAAHLRAYPGMGVFHVDAHADLRVAYEDYIYSHASILYNVMERLDVACLVQVGVRDLCDEELAYIESSAGRVRTHFDHEWAAARLQGQDLRALVHRVLEPLPKEVYVTFDVDGLDPTLCPGTGTPVPGGFSWHEAMLWLDELARSGRRIVGVDLNEVAPSSVAEGRDSWDAIVGARLLYRLIGFALKSRPRA
jgi:agmatinase